MVIGFLSIEAYGFLRAFEKSYSLRIFITFNKLLTLWQLPYEPKLYERHYPRFDNNGKPKLREKMPRMSRALF
jgi:hypothetical protein